MTRQLLVTLTFALSAAVVAGAASQRPAPAPASIAGNWAGKVKTDSGEMQITVELKLEKGKVTGAIGSPHGSWPISDGSVKDDVWTLPFTVEGAGDRWMKGSVRGDTFAGEWNNAPMAVGTFELKRTK